MQAFSYLRVSGAAQVETDGFTRQGIAITTYARAHGIQIQNEFREEGISGRKELEHRPALQSLYASLEDSEVKCILIEKLDRLARDLMVQETILSDLRKRDITVISAMEPDLCSEDPSRKLVRQIFGAISEYERAMIVMKLRGARERKKARTGRCEGRKPFGFYLNEVGTLEYIQLLRSQGCNTVLIALEMNARGYKSRSGRPWTFQTVAKIVARTEKAEQYA